MVLYLEQYAFVWLFLAGIVGVASMGLDKGMASYHWGSRISERSLWLIALAGGFWGIIVGAFVFHHKTSKGEFWPPVAAAVLVWVVGAVLLLRYFAA